jgi:hypothetical protein
VVTAGCTGGDRESLPELPAGETTTATSATPTAMPIAASGPGSDLVVVTTEPPADPVERRVFTDYVTFWQRDMLTLTTGDLTRSGLLDYLFAPQVETTVRYVNDRRRRGIRSQGLLRIAPVVLSARARSAMLRDCLDQTAVVDVDRSGRRTRLTPGLGLTVALTRTPDGRWRVSNLRQTRDPNCR